MNLVKMLVVGLFTALQPLLIYGQIAVGGDTPDLSAALDLQSSSKGFLISRMTTAERNSIASPAVGLMIYNTGTYCLEINVGTTSAPDWSAISCRTGTISGIDCAGATVTGSVNSFLSATGVSVSVPYTGGNSGVYAGQTVSSTGVTGLTATLSAGNFASGSGSLSYTITGTPSAVGTASFALDIGGQSCTLAVASNPPVCRAKTDATTFRDFVCYNLGAANTSADPFTPSWEIIGGYWQWGTLAQAAAGPAGPNAGDANDGAVSGWNTTGAPDGSWSDASKTANDPCPSGFRVPTKAQWDGVVSNNTQTDVGTWTYSPTNYASGKKFGNDLLLPTAGYRSDGNGSLSGRGGSGGYWSSTEGGMSYAWGIYFAVGASDTDNDERTYGLSVRCIAE